MRCRGFNHQLAAKRSFCGPCPGLCRRPASGGARCLRCARMVRIASGSVTSAITRSVPPHSGQTEISISNTRLSRSAQLKEPLIALAKEAGKIDEQQQRQELAQYLAYKRLNALNTSRAKADLAQGTSSPIMSLGKLAMPRILHEEGRLRTKIAGAQSLFEGEQYPRAEDANFLSLNAYFTSIGGGTDQVQRNIIGERVLGLPKEPKVDKSVPFREVRTST